MATTVLHTAASRGHANHGWLDARHTFSFASYHDPNRMHFGALRVLNDDRVAGGMGFGTHPHDNMEIITIPLEGDLQHKDSLGNTAIIRRGMVQVMSAGSGVQHSEFNPNADQHTNLLQIWVFPNKRNVSPRYDELVISDKQQRNALQQVVSPNPDDAGVWIHQDAWFHLGTFDANAGTSYTLKKEGNGVYAFVIKGSFTVAGVELNERDGLGITDTDAFDLTALSRDSEILLMDVPMKF
ncbi:MULTISPECIES: pirin family protein [unclassified Flavobacterium]|uniref:pirin family protein n=1 Tax=unclassified Flavobacterium TaxID=196869 RepID=UPI001F1337E7|nr:MULTISPECIES: pirin family protein [unclassified Flavobacterium]UMY65207.1 pirin family protein [Flavobacterium sp. HJ-32-4]